MSYGICACCHEECDEGHFDDGFHYDYGSITNAYHSVTYTASTCCEAEVLDGSIFLDKTTTQVARKDHTNDKGEVIVQKGQKYRYRIVKGYCVEDGQHIGIFKVRKWIPRGWQS